MVTAGRLGEKLRRRLVFCVLALTSCGRREIVFKSPDGGEQISITFPVVEYGRFDVVWNSPKGKRPLLALEKETFVGLAEVVWLDKPRTVIVFAYGEPGPRIAFDREAMEFRSFEPYRELVRESIRRHYNVERGEDPIEWCQTGEAFEQFYRRFPAADLGRFF